jgi:hypothetical protein
MELEFGGLLGFLHNLQDRLCAALECDYVQPWSARMGLLSARDRGRTRQKNRDGIEFSRRAK